MNLSQIKKIIQLGRFQFIFGGLLLFSFGALLALLLKAEFHLNQLILGYAIFLTAHLSLHYSNDYFDVEVDKHNPPTTFTGGSGILVENPELREFSKWVAMVLTSLSVSFAIIFMIIFSFPLWFLLFVILSNLLVWFYSAQPFRLIDKGLGEIACIIARFPHAWNRLSGLGWKFRCTVFNFYNTLLFLWNILYKQC